MGRQDRCGLFFLITMQSDSVRVKLCPIGPLMRSACIYGAQLPPKCFNTLVDTDLTGTFSFLPPPLGLLHVRALRLFSGNKCGVDVPHHFVFHHCSLVDIEMTYPWPRHVNVSQITAKLRTFDYRVAHAG